MLGAALTWAALGIWLVRHVQSSVTTWNGQGQTFSTVYTLAFLILVWQCSLYFFERPKRITPRQERHLDAMDITVTIPVRNEGVNAFRMCLESILRQTRLPKIVAVVENDNTVDYREVRTWFEKRAQHKGIDVFWETTGTPGKRHAQGIAWRATQGRTQIDVTVDSDANLDDDAIRELVKPFVSPRVQCVAGIVIAQNIRGNMSKTRAKRKKMKDPATGKTVMNPRTGKAAYVTVPPKTPAPRKWRDMLVRLTDLWFVTGQLVDRSAQSALGGVLVNSGVLAAYRREVIWDNLGSYLNETFCGRKIEFSDDSMLTIYSLQKGRAVQQPSAFALTLMPDNFSQLFRMYTRWMRGAFIRTFWRFRYLPLNNYAYWGHLLGWVQMILSTVIFCVLFVWYPIDSGAFIWELFLIPVLIGYGQSLRYLSFRRDDDPLWAHFATFLCAPIAQLFSFFVFRVVRWYAMCTCLKTGWGTRQQVELDVAAAPVEVPVVQQENDTIPMKVLYDPYSTITTELPSPVPIRDTH